MSPIAIEATSARPDVKSENGVLLPPKQAQDRLRKAGIDFEKGYPYYPAKPKYVQDVQKLRVELREGRDYVDPATRADKQKQSLFEAATEVRDLNVNIGTEVIGLQLKDLTDQQKDELALLVAERTVVFFRDQDLSPQAQLDLGLYLGDGEIERHPQAAQVPIEGGGITLIWKAGRREQTEFTYRHPYADGSYGWHTDLVHEPYPPGYTHLHQDAVPEVGGDTLWASGTALYDRFSPGFRSLLDGLNGIYRSAHAYKDETDPDAAPKHVLRVHPLIRTIPATGHKAVFANRAMTVGIEGLDKRESDAILNHIFDVYERSTDLQVRWHWTPGTSAIWDNRSSIHTVSNDYIPGSDRHGTRVSSLAEKPYFDPKSQSRRQALQLD